MDAIILDKREEAHSTCFLTKILLKDYIGSLSEDYQDYEIQREIVTNTYLDNLVTTVINKQHIPPIVLIINESVEDDNVLKILNFKILDGLQRTYRLNSIWKTALLVKREIDQGIDFSNKSKYELSKMYSKELIKFDSSMKVFQYVLKYYNENKQVADFNLLDFFENNYQWFEVWKGLTADEEVNKMLILNAGHKPVKIKHQLELIFRNLIPLLNDIGVVGFNLIREREQTSIQFSKNRNIGDFHFSHIIAALLSLKDGKPVTTNSDSIQILQNEEFDTESDSQYFTFSFLKEYIKSLLEIDLAISSQFSTLGIKWFGREVTLVGIYGALGAVNKSMSLEMKLDQLVQIVKRDCSQLNLSAFEEARNNLDLGKVNIGSKNRNAIYSAFLNILTEGRITSINWQFYFS